MKQKETAILLAYFCSTGLIAGMSIVGYGGTLVTSTALVEPYAVLWNATFGGPGSQSPVAVIRAGDGYLVVGDNQTSTLSGQKVCLLSVDRNGQLIWCRSYGRDGEDWSAMDLVEASNGGYVVVGCAAPRQYAGGKGVAILVLKVDSAGTLLWNRTYSDAYWQHGMSIVDAGHGEYLVLGVVTEEGGFNYDVYLMKIDSEGKVLWNRTYGGDRYDWGYKIARCTTGGYIIAGATTSWHLEGQDPRFTHTYVLRIREDGRKIWETTYGGVCDSRAHDLVETEPGVYVLAGSHSQDLEYGSRDMYVLKIQEEGKLIWERTYGGDNEDGATALATSPRGIIITGQSHSYGPEVTTYVAELDYTNGLLLWETTYGSSGWDVVEAEKNGVLIVEWIVDESGTSHDIRLIRLYHGESPIPAISPLLIVTFPFIILAGRWIIHAKIART